MKDDLNVQLQESEEYININNKQKSKSLNLIPPIIIFFILVGITVFMYFALKKEGDKRKKSFELYKNISSAINGTILNSFKEGGVNYIQEVGNVNEGRDYQENERDNFDLCVPTIFEKDKNNFTRIILMIHGGAWVHGEKQDISGSCELIGSKGFISASMSYSLLNSTYKETSIFRILDEVNAVSLGIKNKMKSLGFDENKIQIVLYGGSAGAHISMLYAYLMKKFPIPVKFILNLVGPATMHPEHFLINKNLSETLEGIYPKDIDEATKEGKLDPLNLKTKYSMNNYNLLSYLNLFLGRKFDNNFSKMIIDFEKMTIDESSEAYKELISKSKHAFPIHQVKRDTIPTLCGYGGNDTLLGVGHFAELKKAFEAAGNEKIDMVYFRNSGHMLDIKSKEGMKEWAKFEEKTENFTKKYLK